MSIRPYAVLVGLLALVPLPAAAQNTTFGTAVHLLVGQSPVRVTPAMGETRYYDAPVVINRSYCAEATASESEVNEADPALSVFRADMTTAVGSDSGTTVEPKGQVAARVCFIAAAIETHFFALAPASAPFAGREYTLRVVETTLFSNWFFLGGDYSSFTLLRNTTNMPVNYTVFWRNADGAVLGTTSGSLAANGIVFLNARDIPAVLTGLLGSVEVVHTGSPEAVVGSQTTLSGGTGLSFDTILSTPRLVAAASRSVDAHD